MPTPREERARFGGVQNPLHRAKTKSPWLLSAFLAEKWQTQNFGRELVFSADLCYNEGSVKASLRDAIRKRMRGTALAVEGACVTLDLC